jgi:hypothetical protein
LAVGYFFTVKGTKLLNKFFRYLFERRGPHAAVSPVFVTVAGERI